MRRFLPPLLALVFLSVLACSDNQVGTRTGNPSTPTSQVIPDLTAVITEESLGGAAAEDTESSVAATIKHTARALSAPASEWTDIFLAGLIADARTQRASIQAFAEAIADKLEAADIDAITSETHVTLAATTLVDTTANWDVLAKLDGTLDNTVRMYFTNDDQDRIEGSYLFDVSDGGLETERGFLIYVNPDVLSTDASSGHRLLGVAFDFRDSSANVLTVFGDQYVSRLGYFVSYILNYDCNTEKECMGEFLAIETAAPTRALTHSLRYAWDDDTLDVCLTEITYSDDASSLGPVQIFTGPAQPAEADVVVGTIEDCPVVIEAPRPFWSSYIYSTDDLPLRSGDAGSGFSGSSLYGDGVATVGWDSMDYYSLSE